MLDVKCFISLASILYQNSYFANFLPKYKDDLSSAMWCPKSSEAKSDHIYGMFFYICYLHFEIHHKSPYNLRFGPGKVLEKSLVLIHQNLWEPWKLWSQNLCIYTWWLARNYLIFWLCWANYSSLVAIKDWKQWFLPSIWKVNHSVYFKFGMSTYWMSLQKLLSFGQCVPILALWWPKMVFFIIIWNVEYLVNIKVSVNIHCKNPNRWCNFVPCTCSFHPFGNTKMAEIGVFNHHMENY